MKEVDVLGYYFVEQLINNMRNKLNLSVEPHREINFTECSSEPTNAKLLEENVDFQVWMGDVSQGLSIR